MQIAQIVQVLAMSRWDDIDPKVKDLYSRFEKVTRVAVEFLVCLGFELKMSVCLVVAYMAKTLTISFSQILFK